MDGCGYLPGRGRGDNYHQPDGLLAAYQSLGPGDTEPVAGRA
jgi:hypothetical protein